MEKMALSIEQMQKLESLGMNTSDASMMYLDNGNGNMILGFKNISFDEKEGDIPAYTLSDLLSKLQGIEHESSDLSGNYHLFAPRFWGDGFNQMAWVDLMNPSSSPMMTTGNIDSLTSAYQMLLWCIENGYIKTK